MREALVFLTNLDYQDTHEIMISALETEVSSYSNLQVNHQARNPNWNRHTLNSLCWAIGSISGAVGNNSSFCFLLSVLDEESEKKFVVTVIKDLLGMCEMARGKDNKAAIGFSSFLFSLTFRSWKYYVCSWPIS